MQTSSRGLQGHARAARRDGVMSRVILLPGICSTAEQFHSVRGTLACPPPPLCWERRRTHGHPSFAWEMIREAVGGGSCLEIHPQVGKEPFKVENVLHNVVCCYLCRRHFHIAMQVWVVYYFTSIMDGYGLG